MAEKVEVNFPPDNSPYRVALDLAYRIAASETGEKDRKYWLELYVRCRRVVKDGMSTASALKD